ncbi:MAG: site-specific integrase [Pseudomonadota bacterium]|nr:site-specific integrase [Pseudomonadota bacterium]
MVSFRSADKQAAFIMKQLQGTVLKSVGTVRNYEQSLTRVGEYVKAQRLGDLRGLTPELAVDYLDSRSLEVGQKTLDMERQAIQCMLLHVTGKLDPDERLPVIKSEHEQILASRAYTPQQVQLVAGRQAAHHALATELAHHAGLRAHELLTLRPLAERPADARPALASKFQGRDGTRYTVHGKGGLTREVRLSRALTERLEARRLEAPITVTDRNIRYQQYYALGGGRLWSNSYSAASARTLGWSTGGHGLRHSYAQERMDELQQSLPYEQALETVSQEMGHFRPDITEVYLR